MFGNVLLVLLPLCSPVAVIGSEEVKNWKTVENWPLYSRFGQVSAVSVDTSGNVYVFHRGDRVWDASTFVNNIFQKKDLEPIRDGTVVILDSDDGKLIHKVGGKRFYMPHGLTVDHMNNIWITDVAMHQVFKFPPLNVSSQNTDLAPPEIVLGTKFEPGNDDHHFCKPTDVAVDKSTGDFYVSDGYCNSRIIKYDRSGKKLLSWGRSPTTSALDPYTLTVPHALSMADDKKLLFVADRENFRALAYEIPKGIFNFSLQEHERVFSIAYSSEGGGYLFTVSNSVFQSGGDLTVYSLKTNKIVQRISPRGGFSSPHDVAVSSDGKCCYVVELSPYKVWKFHVEADPDTEQSFIQPEKLEVTGSELDNLISKADTKDADQATHHFFVGTLLAIGLVSFVIIITFSILILHFYKKKGGYAQYEMRRLILDDEEEVGINAS